MSAWRDAAENVRFGLAAIWKSMTPEARAFCVGLAVGFATGAITVALWVR